MSQWLQEKYIALVGTQLGYFHRQSRTTYGFRCPFCGDSKRRANKTRGYFFLHRGQYFYKCHNCNISMSLRSFLRQQAPELFREYQLDVLRQERPLTPLPAPQPPEATMFGFGKPRHTMTLPSIASLPNDHDAVRYCRERALPDTALAQLYFTTEWTTWIREMQWSYALAEDHAPRLILPWYNRDQQLLGAQARRIDATGSAARYITLKHDNCEDKIYGWDRVDLYKLIYVVEGPLDSWFLPNAVASMDSDLLRLHDKYFHQRNAVYVWDNEPRNAVVSANLYRAVKANLPVVIWPEAVKEKDLNDMAKAGYNTLDLVQRHTFRGLRAELEFLRWKRISK